MEACILVDFDVIEMVSICLFLSVRVERRFILFVCFIFIAISSILCASFEGIIILFYIIHMSFITTSVQNLEGT